jgi:2-oxo-4-hydroxy-4-carboxy--5-ureidoimidazoline (OHCU) decarboxylase
MNTESDTPRTDEVAEGYWYSEMLNHAEQLERELAAAMAALRNLTHEIGRHESASMMHPRLTRAIAAANRLTNEKKEQEKSIGT